MGGIVKLICQVGVCKAISKLSVAREWSPEWFVATVRGLFIEKWSTEWYGAYEWSVGSEWFFVRDRP